MPYSLVRAQQVGCSTEMVYWWYSTCAHTRLLLRRFPYSGRHIGVSILQLLQSCASSLCSFIHVSLYNIAPSQFWSSCRPISVSIYFHIPRSHYYNIRPSLSLSTCPNRVSVLTMSQSRWSHCLTYVGHTWPCSYFFRPDVPRFLFIPFIPLNILPSWCPTLPLYSHHPSQHSSVLMSHASSLFPSSVSTFFRPDVPRFLFIPIIRLNILPSWCPTLPLYSHHPSQHSSVLMSHASSLFPSSVSTFFRPDVPRFLFIPIIRLNILPSWCPTLPLYSHHPSQHSHSIVCSF